MKDIHLLGLKVTDQVTGFTGVVVSVCYDLYGCIQAVVMPAADAAKGKLEDGRWFDTKRLRVDSTKAVMEVPNFVVVAGPAEKPARDW